MMIALASALGAWAQDDMYFTPKKKAKSQSAVTSEVVDADAPYRYRVPAEAVGDNDEEVDYGNSDRDVDEYNRRGSAYAGTPQSRYDEIDSDDSVVISRDEYEDYQYSRNMQRFDGYNGLTLVVNDPWYYDSWYWGSPYYSSLYWRSSWYDPWYSWYDPWYRSSYWGWGYNYRYSWYGGYTWHRPYYSYYRPYYGRTTYRRGGYSSDRGTTYGRHSYGYRNRGGVTHGSVSRGGNAANRGSVRNPPTASSTRRSTVNNSSSRGGYIGNGSNYGGNSSNTTRSSSSYGNSSSTRSNSSYGNSSSTRSSGGSSYGGGTRSGGGGGFSGGGSRGGGSHGGGRR